MSRGVTQARLTQRVAGLKIPKAYCIAGGIRTPIQTDYAAFMLILEIHLGTKYTCSFVP